MEVMKENVNYIKGDMENIREAVKDTKKVEDEKEIKTLMETMSIRKGEFLFDCFLFCIKGVMNSDSLNKFEDSTNILSTIIILFRISAISLVVKALDFQSRVPCSKPLGVCKVDSAFYVPEVDK